MTLSSVRISSATVLHATKLAEEIEQSSDSAFVYRQTAEMLRLGGAALRNSRIPRLVVFGQQSQGKSTLLDYVVGAPIGHTDTRRATKCPICISIKARDFHGLGLLGWTILAPRAHNPSD